MLGFLGKIFGADTIIEKGMDLIDSIHYSDSEEAEDKRKAIESKARAKIDLMGAYAPFKLAQRYLAFAFTFVFIFIMMNGVLGTLYGWIDIQAVEEAKAFANDMWLGEIMIAIVSFYFGGGLVDSIKKGK